LAFGLGLASDPEDVVLRPIVTAARTLLALKGHILAQHPARLRTAVLLDKPARRAVPDRRRK